MNIFFHSQTKSTSGRTVCKKLSSCSGQSNIMKLRPTAGLSSPLPVSIRSGDIIFFYIEHPGQLDDLLAEKDCFECFRKIILVAFPDPPLDFLMRCQRLSPRYIAHGNNSVEKAAAVAQKMLSSLSQPKTEVAQYS